MRLNWMKLPKKSKVYKSIFNWKIRRFKRRKRRTLCTKSKSINLLNNSKKNLTLKVLKTKKRMRLMLRKLWKQIDFKRNWPVWKLKTKSMLNRLLQTWKEWSQALSFQKRPIRIWKWIMTPSRSNLTSIWKLQTIRIKI